MIFYYVLMINECNVVWCAENKKTTAQEVHHGKAADNFSMIGHWLFFRSLPYGLSVVDPEKTKINFTLYR